MHLFKKSIGLLAVLCVMPASFAATSSRATQRTLANDARVSMATTSVGRMPTMAVKIGTTTSGTTTTSDGAEVVITPASLLENSECIDAYSECIRGSDACGENFEECTTRDLFHVKMPNCLSTLAQCSNTGVDTLFGRISGDVSGDIAKLSKMTDDEYIYPTVGSQIGSWITSAAIANRYDKSTCVRRYTACLKKDTVCGEDFELCTSNTAFKKQNVFCESTLARCQDDGKMELFGSTSSSDIKDDSRIGQMIKEGGDLAAVNSVSTCYKTIDQCILNACSENPFRCYETSNGSVEEGRAILAEYVDIIKAGKALSDDQINNIMAGISQIDKKSIRKYISNACFATIGSNKYCYATFIGDGKMPTNAQLRDETNQEIIFDEAYASRMNESMRAKISDLVEKFDTSAKEKCTETIKSCAMRTCGGGVGPACYSSVFSKKGQNSINGKETRSEIKTGCSAVVNTDMYCKYAAANPGEAGSYSYSYINNDAFDKLFPEYDDTKKSDPIGVIAALNSSLSTNYNAAAIDAMAKSCENVAKNCVKSMCGADYINCYRSRTDVLTDKYQTDDTKFNDSMNKVGGVLDYTVVIGLCMDTVKNSTSCEEHLAIQATKTKVDSKSGWGANTSVRDAWNTAARSINATEYEHLLDEDNGVIDGCTSKDESNCPGVMDCDTVTSDGCTYDVPHLMSVKDYKLTNAATTLFQKVLADIEQEAQAQYKEKIIREQRMCESSNDGGVRGVRDLGSTFMWVKLRSNKVPKNYTVDGLKSSQFVESNDLYGSFCRVRITLQSDDKTIQEKMKNATWNTAYFATGDTFTCGSWIPESALNEMAEDAARKATGRDGSDTLTSGQKWGVAGASLLSAIAGGVGMDLLQSKTSLGGLLNTAKNYDTTVKTAATNCVSALTKGGSAIETVEDNEAAINRAMSAVAGIKDRFDDLQTAYNNLQTERSDNNLKAFRAQCVAMSGWDDTAIKANMDKNFWSNGGGRALIDATGATITGVAGGVLTYHAIKASNVTKFTAAQQEFMNNVGRHITCYIGGDEAGSYGDIITTSLE